MGKQTSLFGDEQPLKKTHEVSLSKLKVNSAEGKLNQKINLKIKKLQKLKKQVKLIEEKCRVTHTLFQKIVEPKIKSLQLEQEKYVVNLFKFYEKKSTSKTYKECAEFEINRTLTQISQNGELSPKMLKISDKLKKLSFSNLSDLEKGVFEEEIERLKHQIKEDLGIDIDFSLDDFINKGMESLIMDAHKKADSHAQQEKEDQKAELKKKRQKFEDSDFKKLYKKLAKVLHPDIKNSKLSDTERDQLIKDLSEAWENRDYLKILIINNEIFPNDNDIKIDKKQLIHFDKQLKEEIYELNNIKYNITHGSSFEASLYRDFYDKNMSVTEFKFEKEVDKIEEILESLRDINFLSFKNIPITKEYLEEYVMAEFEDMKYGDDFFDDFLFDEMEDDYDLEEDELDDDDGSPLPF